jgi:hypothetical protein
MFLITTTIIAMTGMITQPFLFYCRNFQPFTLSKPENRALPLLSLPFWDMTWVSMPNLQGPGLVHIQTFSLITSGHRGFSAKTMTFVFFPTLVEEETFQGSPHLNILGVSSKSQQMVRYTGENIARFKLD